MVRKMANLTKKSEAQKGPGTFSSRVEDSKVVYLKSSERVNEDKIKKAQQIITENVKKFYW